MRLCVWCQSRAVVGGRGDKLYCSQSCRQRAYEWRLTYDRLVRQMRSIIRQAESTLATVDEHVGKRHGRRRAIPPGATK